MLCVGTYILQIKGFNRRSIRQKTNFKMFWILFACLEVLYLATYFPLLFSVGCFHILFYVGTVTYTVNKF
jgi:hypothetical protein